MVWDRWETTFDKDFWMTAQERHEMVEREQLALSEQVSSEQHAVDALFGLFGSTPKKTSPASTVFTIHGENTELGNAIEEVVAEIVENGDVNDLEVTKHTGPLEAIVHEIPRKDVALDLEVDMNSIQKTVDCVVNPVENGERERREEERISHLKEKETNGTLTYREKQKMAFKELKQEKKEPLLS